jgi:hypothetical protein
MDPQTNVNAIAGFDRRVIAEFIVNLNDRLVHFVTRRRPMNTRRFFVAGFVLAAVFTLGVAIDASQPSSPQQNITFNDDDKTATIDCKGGSAIVNGDDNALTIQGECSRLMVNGDDNTIDARTVTELTVSGDDNNIRVDTVAKINTFGDDNNITWARGAGGKSPEVSNTGDDNNTRQGRE